MSRGSNPQSANSRNDARPVRRRTRTFRLNYISFAGTYVALHHQPAALRFYVVSRAWESWPVTA
jgi:hypothetical protein